MVPTYVTGSLSELVDFSRANALRFLRLARSSAASRAWRTSDCVGGSGLSSGLVIVVELLVVPEAIGLPVR
jgi:hypothetical protein